jgi:hypothetical protein
VTQIELLPCPFCGGRAELIACLSSQAPPSAVDEGHDFETQQIMIADPRKFIVTHVYKVKRDGWQRVDSYQCASAESARILLEMLTRSLSSQAPKPASAGGEPIPPFEPTNAMSTAGKHYMKGQEELFERQQAIGCWRVMYKAWQESIAAEADTAKVCAECGGIDRYHVTTCSKSLLIETLAADRLAPIEARGVESNYYQDFFDRYGIPSLTKPSCFACGHAKDERGIEHAVLPNMYICTDCVSALRARESAPAVEK